MKDYKIFLTIAGNDCIGGAGVLADVKTATHFGLYSTGIVTAVTAQNSRGVTDCNAVDSLLLTEQLDAVFSDVHPDCVKIGLLPDRESVECVADALRRYPHGPVVLDPVLAPTLGKRFGHTEEIAKAMVEVLAPLVDVVTPNKNELALLSIAANADPVAIEIFGEKSLRYMTGILQECGFRNILLTGSESATDTIFTPEGNCYELEGNPVETTNHHGTGCCYSSALACALALGEDLSSAASTAKKFVADALEKYKSYEFGHGYGPANFFLS